MAKNRRNKRGGKTAGGGVKQMLDAGLAAHQRGDMAEAGAIYQRILEDFPRQPDALNLLGVVALQTGQPHSGLALFDKALAVNTRNPGYHNNRGEALRALGQMDEALGAFRSALKLDKAFADACINATLAATATGDLTNASDFADRAVKLAPQALEAHMALAEVRRAQADWPGALSACQRAAELSPEHPEVQLALGFALAAVDDSASARKAFMNAMELAPQASEPRVALAQWCQEQGRHEEAENFLTQALRLNPVQPDAALALGRILNGRAAFTEAVSVLEAAGSSGEVPSTAMSCELAWALSQSGELERAIALLHDRLEVEDAVDVHALLGRIHALTGNVSRAIQRYQHAVLLAPEVGQFHANLGDMHLEAGDFEAAERSLRTAIRLEPDSPRAYESLVDAAGATRVGAETVAALRKLSDADSLTTVDRATALYALARIDDQDFTTFARANDLMRSEYPFDAAVHEQFVDRIIATFSSRVGEPESPGASEPMPWKPVFIVGMPRSGTSLTEQILASHSSVHGAGEVEFFNHLKFRAGSFPEACTSLSDDDIRQLRRDYVARVRLTREITADVVTDKMPHNFLYLGLIARLFPEAVIVHCARAPMDNCVSLYFQNFTAAPAHAYSFDLSGLGRYYSDYRRLMAHWQAVLPLRVHELSYESLVAAQERESRALLQAVGLPWHEAVLRFHETKRDVQTASAAQVRQPIYSSSVERWRRYEAELAPLAAALGRALV